MDYSELLNQLVQRGAIATPLIIEAFKKIKREDFLPLELKSEAGFDGPLPIGFGQTNSQPSTVAFMLELLRPEPEQKILDIGSGSGWTSALLAWCVGDRGKVIAVERIGALCEFGKKNISKYNFVGGGRVECLCGDAISELTQKDRFDRILASASANEIPQGWLKRLKVGGRLVLPVQNSVWFVIKKGENEYEKKEFPGFAFVPLVKSQE